MAFSPIRSSRSWKTRGGKLWMSTSSGVISADRKELDAAAEGSKPSIHVIPYGTAEGMATSQMNGGFQPAGARTAAGDLWFPSVKGAVRISPSRIPVRHTAPVLIERIVADDRATASLQPDHHSAGTRQAGDRLHPVRTGQPTAFQFPIQTRGIRRQLDAGPARPFRLLYESSAGSLSLPRDGQRLRILKCSRKRPWR